MAIGTGLAIYFLIWWLCLFIVLPFGARSQVESGEVDPGTDPGAPKSPQIGKKLLINTIISAVIYAIYWFVTARLGFSLDQLPSPFPNP